jgi:hypothetical protein
MSCEWREADGERVLYDRFDDVYFPHALVMDSFRRVLQMTPGPALGVIPDAAVHVESRRPTIAAALRGKRADTGLADLSEVQLRDFEKDELAFVILSVDVKGSTKLARAVQRGRAAARLDVLGQRRRSISALPPRPERNAAPVERSPRQRAAD